MGAAANDDRYLYAIGLGILAAVEAVILTLPLGYYLGRQHRPKSEFAGLGVFSHMLTTGGVAAGITLLFTFTLVAIWFNHESAARFGQAMSTLATAIAAAIGAAIAVGLLGGDGLSWGIGLSAVVLVIGMIRVLMAGSPSL